MINTIVERSITINLPKNLGILLLGIWLIVYGLIQVLALSFSGLYLLMGIFAIVIGILLILQR
jgi:uncharacterized membrane protein HdeD (DUF308 family)